MNYKQPRGTVKNGPEERGARRLRRLMESKGWYIKKLHGGKYQSGLPDLLCLHPLHGLRWVETKAPGGKVKQSQIHQFNIMNRFGQKVYVLEDERDYHKIFLELDNWKQYIRL